MPELVEKKRPGVSWGTLLRVGVTVGLLVFLARTQDWNKLYANFLQADFVWLGFALVVFSGSLFFVFLRWWFLLKVQGIELPIPLVLRLNAIGFFFNNVLPGSTGGDLVKIFYVMRFAPDRKARAALSILMDRVLGVLIILSLTALLLPGQISNLQTYEQTRSLVWSIPVLLGVLFAGLAVASFMPLGWFPEPLKKLWLKVPKHDVLESLVVGFQQHVKCPKLLASATAVSILGQCFNFATGWLVARALHLDVGIAELVVIMCIVMCIQSLPVSVSGHGLRETAYVFMFAAYGVIDADPLRMTGETEKAVVFSILYFLITLAWSLVCGLVYLTFQKEAVVPSGVKPEAAKA